MRSQVRELLARLVSRGGPPAGRRRRSGRFSFAIRAALAGLAIVLVVPSPALADPPVGYDWNAPWEHRWYEPAFDYDWDGCYPTAAIGWQYAQINPGLPTTGYINANCHDPWDLDEANIYSRVKCNNGWCAYMYAVYFEKDQTTLPGCSICGHRHDWEHVVVWVQNGWADWVSASAHGNYNIRHRNNVRWDDGGTHPTIVYHKDGGGTHAFRFADWGEQPENHKGWWQFPKLVNWDWLPQQHRDALTWYDFGSASFGLKNGNFEWELSKAKPAAVPFNPWG
ncbi:hypothetical protein Aph01nite_40610 [Acrocarpospora phusangensis]|uniref:Necrosis inducing protein (NPP1) n=1 Tax=Acrocarpospora phusangensis TaxID=1070424 RepID=A0A919QBG9_9ACTN|nr:hypothetical protein Aph01nite_40610 [Acrocarpospora phusangensis]